MASTLPRTAAVPTPGRPSRRGTRARASSTERVAVLVVAGIAAVVAAFAPVAPTTTWVVDRVFTMAFVALVVLAASRARRWTWLVLAGLAVLAADQTAMVAVAGVALLCALAGALLARHRILGALTAAFAVQVLLRLPELGFLGSSALFAAIAVAPACISGYVQSGHRVRRRVRRVALASGAVAALGLVVFLVAAGFAYRKAADGVASANEGLSAIGDGRASVGVSSFDQAQAQLADASDIASGWWMLPTRVVPVLSQHAKVLSTVTDHARILVGAAGRSAREADVQTLKYESGRIDLARVRAAQAPLGETEAALVSTRHAIDDVDSPWLLAPAADRLSEFSAQVDSALADTSVAALGVRVAPGMLGGDGTRQYFVMCTQPAEARGLGGFMGSWALLTANGGAVELTASGRAKDLNDAPGRSDRALSGPTDFVDRYGRFRPEYYMQDVTFSPDFPTVADVMRQLYPQTGGPALDGVIAVDPAGLAALMQITGPITVKGLDQKLTAANAEKFLLRDQYIQFADRDQREAREDVLEEVSRTTFDKLVKGSLPSPKKVGDVLGPAVEGRHLMVHMFRADEQQLFSMVGASGQIVPAEPTRDYFSLVTQNKGNNKIDVFLERSVTYDVEYDPTTGKVEAKATITLHNGAPSEGLPESVIGSNDQGLPPGTNAMYLSVYTPHRLRSAMIDGESAGMEYQRELGYAVYSRFLEIPPGGAVTVVLDLAGQLGDPGLYQLGVGAQPIPNPDTFTATVKPPPGWYGSPPTVAFALLGRGQEAATTVRLDRDQDLAVWFLRGAR